MQLSSLRSGILLICFICINMHFTCLSFSIFKYQHFGMHAYAFPDSPNTTHLHSPKNVTAKYEEGKIKIQIQKKRWENQNAFAHRILDRSTDWYKLAPMKKNADGSKFIEVPFTLLNDDYQKIVQRLVFSKDHFKESDWIHVVTYKGETLWFIASIFTGQTENYKKILETNGLLPNRSIVVGQKIKIASTLLIHAFQKVSEERLDTTQVDVTVKNNNVYKRGKRIKLRDPELKFIVDGKKEYGVYQLKQGEALYSAVVIRFTGRVDAADVTKMTHEIMRINNIHDETTIPVKQKIRIPREWIDESLFTEKLVKVSKRSKRKREVLHVILDAGHGGDDPGAMVEGWREDRIAFDLMQRVHRGLERKGVNVYPVVSAHKSRSKMSKNKKHLYGNHKYVQVTPPYYLADSRVGVNLRIYLIDAIYSRLKNKGIAIDDIILLSIHLDYLHPSARGAMIYVPGAKERVSKFKAAGSVYKKFKESRNRVIKFSRSANQHAESTSEGFAEDLVTAFQQARLAIHAYEPIRYYVYRKGKKWTPGIIRYSRVPTSILLEAANLSNSNDLKKIRTRAFRQKLADSIVRTILSRQG